MVMIVIVIVVVIIIIIIIIVVQFVYGIIERIGRELRRDTSILSPGGIQIMIPLPLTPTTTKQTEQ